MLEEKRQKIRLIQQRKLSEKDLIDLKDMPQEIPITLSIGHRVYSHVSHPEEGVFLGTIAAVDPCEHTYRVVFDRASLGSQTVYDYEIKSLTPLPTIPIKAYIQTFRPKVNSNLSQQSSLMMLMTPSKLNASIGIAGNCTTSSTIVNSENINASFASQINTPLLSATSLLGTNQLIFDKNLSAGMNTLLMDDLNNLNSTNPSFAAALMFQSNVDPMLGNVYSPYKLNTPLGRDSSILNGSSSATNASVAVLGGFPIHLLLMVTRLNKILNFKKDYVNKLNKLNREAERIKASDRLYYNKEFQLNYATVVLDLEKLNKDLSDYLIGVQRYCEEIMPESFTKLKTNIITAQSKTKPIMERANEAYLIEAKKLFNRLNHRVSKPAEQENVASNSGSHLQDQIEIKENQNETGNGLIDSNLNNLNLSDNNSSCTTNENDDTVIERTQLRQQQEKFIALEKTKLIKSNHVANLIEKVTALLMQLGDFVDSTALADNSNIPSQKLNSDHSHLSFLPFSAKSLDESINSIKKTLLSETNVQLFENKVQVHLNHIQSSLSYHNRLQAFKYELPDKNSFDKMEDKHTILNNSNSECSNGRSK
jgi:hypothetical protein